MNFFIDAADVRAQHRTRNGGGHREIWSGETDASQGLALVTKLPSWHGPSFQPKKPDIVMLSVNHKRARKFRYKG